MFCLLTFFPDLRPNSVNNLCHNTDTFALVHHHCARLMQRWAHVFKLGWKPFWRTLNYWWIIYGKQGIQDHRQLFQMWNPNEKYVRQQRIAPKGSHTLLLCNFVGWMLIPLLLCKQLSSLINPILFCWYICAFRLIKLRYILQLAISTCMQQLKNTTRAKDQRMLKMFEWVAQEKRQEIVRKIQ